MSDMLVSFNENEEEVVRRLALEKYGGKKGSLSQIIKDGIKKLQDEERIEVADTLGKIMKKAEYKLPKFKNRSEMYD